MHKIKTVAYCRVSTGSEEQANSFTNQKEHFTKYIQESEDMIFVGIYADKGITGTSLNKRPEFNRMLQDAGLDIVDVRGKKYVLVDGGRNPRFNLILVSNTSRFARNILVVDILRELSKKSVHVYFTDINKTTANPDDWSYIQLFLNFDEMDSRDKSNKVTQGHKRSSKRGRMHTNGKLYGYTYDTTTKTLSIIEEEAKVIRFIFEQYAAGEGIRRVRDMLYERGIKTRKGKVFAESTISKMLQNEKYKGTLVRNKYTTGRIFVNKHYSKVLPQEEWFVFEDDDRVPAIVDADLWEKCQEVRASKVSSQMQAGKYKGRSEYAGKIFCSKCGATYSQNNNRGTVFFNCATKKARGVAVCDSKNVSLKFVKEQEDMLVSNYMRNVKELTGAYIAQLEAIKRVLYRRLDDSRAQEIVSLQEQRQEISERIEQLLGLMTNTSISITADKIAESITKLEGKLVETDSKIHELSKDNNTILSEIAQIEGMQEELEQQRHKKMTRKQILSSVEKMTVVYVKEANELRIDFTLRLEKDIKEMTSKYIDSEAHKEAVTEMMDNVF